MACKSIIMIYRSSWSFVAPHRFFAKLRILHLVNFTDGTVFQTFFYILADIVLIFWHVSQLPAFLKAAYKDRHISYILNDDQIPPFTSKRILYLQEYMQPVGDLVLPCNTFRMLVSHTVQKCYLLSLQLFLLLCHLHLTLSQTTNFRPYQIERVCRRQF